VAVLGPRTGTMLLLSAYNDQNAFADCPAQLVIVRKKLWVPSGIACLLLSKMDEVVAEDATIAARSDMSPKTSLPAI